MNFFKKLLILIKETILKKQPKTKKTPCKEDSSNYNKLYSEIEVGSIIWAKRYRNESELEKIPEGHEEGPFLVLKKEKGNIYCFYGSGTFLETNCSILLDNVEYDFLIKPTYFNLYKLRLVNEFSLIKILGNLNKVDINNLYGKIKYYKRKFYNDEGKRLNIEMPRQCGDLVLYNNKKYVVLDIYDNKLSCIPFNHIDESASNLDYSKIYTLDDKKDIILIGALSNKQLINSLNNYKNYIKNQENKNKTQRGSVVFKNNKYYYIYGEEGEEFLAFEIFKLYAKKSDILNLNNTIYYTFYNECRISKKEDYKNIYLCLDKEKQLIKEKRKNYKLKKEKITKPNNIQETSNKISVGSIIKLNEFSDEEFYVDSMIGSILVCVEQTERNQVNPKKHYFNINDVILVNSYKKIK